jgi:hypothetical protein
MRIPAQPKQISGWTDSSLPKSRLYEDDGRDNYSVVENPRGV